MSLFIFSEYDNFMVDIRSVVGVGYVLSHFVPGIELTIAHYDPRNSMAVPTHRTIIASSDEANAFHEALQTSHNFQYSLEGSTGRWEDKRIAPLMATLNQYEHPFHIPTLSQSQLHQAVPTYIEIEEE